MHRLQELVRLHRMGVGARKVAQMLKMGPNTERNYREALARAGLLSGKPDELPEPAVLKAAVLAEVEFKPAPQQESSIARWRPRIEKLMGDGLGPKAILDRLRLENDEFAGKIGAVKRMVKRIRRERGPQAKDVAIPIESSPGEIAQVDFGFAGWQWDPDRGKRRKSWVFVMVLAHSRHQYAEVVFDQRVGTWLRLHQRAFEHLGGVPETVVPDNLKAAVIRAAFGASDSPALNRSYVELARHYGFKIDPTPPRSPEKKGTVESSVKYVKRNFLRGRDGEPLEETNHALARWVTEVAGQRIHGTTGRKPLEVFEDEERGRLLPLPSVPFEPVAWKKAKVHRDSHVIFERRLYSVPWKLMDREVWIRATPQTVAIYFNDERVATHRRHGAGPRSTEDAHLPAEREPYRHRSRPYWEERADAIGDDVGRYIREVFDSGGALSKLGTVQTIVLHLESFPPERAQAACRRASFYGAMTFQAIKSILAKALDTEPLPTTRVAATWADAPRFARDVSELLPTEVSRERH